MLNNYSLEDIKKYTNELGQYYKEYLKQMVYYIYKNNKTIDNYISHTLVNFKNIIKKNKKNNIATINLIKKTSKTILIQ